MVGVANAPVSYGAFELTVGILPDVPDRDAVLDEVAGAGYAGIDLGPLGYLGKGEDLAASLRRRKLGLSGGFFELPFSDLTRMAAALRQLGALLDVFDDAGVSNGLRAKPTLADIGSDLRRSRPGQAAHIEAPWEIEKVLELTSIGLCLDTGHLLLGGGDPVRAMREWGQRINHLHLKDARRSVVDGIVREAAPVTEIWRRQAFCRLGEGDLDVDAVLDAVRKSYAGWIVVEQDVLPDPNGRAAADQRANREYLAARGF